MFAKKLLDHLHHTHSDVFAFSIFFGGGGGSLINRWASVRNIKTNWIRKKYILISDNFAYGKQASQKQTWDSHSAHFAVDSNATTCTVVQPGVDNPWWMVNIEKQVLIFGFRIFFSDQTYGKLLIL